MIAKPGEGHLLDRCLKSVFKYVHEIHITTQEKNTDIEKVCKKYKAEIHYRDWDFNFANQRNFSFQFATKDWILWLDTDDVFINPEKLRPVVKLTPEEANAIVVNYLYEQDKYGNRVVEQWRERIIRRDSGYKWVGAVHETLIDPNYSKIVKTKDFEIHHLPEDGTDKVSVRNLQILEKEIKKEKEEGKEVDPRLVYYLGVTYKSLEMYEEAYTILSKFVLMSGWDEQRFDAYLNMSDVGIALKNKDLAIDNALLAIKERPDFPDGYYQVGKAYYNFEIWDKTVGWIEMGLEKKDIQTDWIVVGRKPQALLHLAGSLTNLGRFDESTKILKKLVKLWPDQHGIKKQIKINKELQEQKDVTNAFFKIWNYNSKKDANLNTHLFESVPKEMKDNPAILQMKWDSEEPKKWENSIVIYCGGSFDEWSPAIVDKGIGGSEEAVIYLGKELTQLGWNVTVFNNCGNHKGIYDGVEYKNIWEFNPNDEYDVLVGWRTPGFYEREYTARKKYLWMHDVFPDDVWTPTVLRNLDKVIVLSKYHRSLWPSLPEEKVYYSRNGINIGYYNKKGTHKKHRLLYSSCPSRGLEILFDIWPEVKKEVPDAELHFFYGWGNWEKGNANYPNRIAWMHDMQRKSKQDGIFDHGRIGHKQLIDEMYNSDILAYPCITGDTLIDMPRDYSKYPMGVPIKKLVGKKNFLVWSHNEETGKFELKNATKVALTRKKANIIKVNWTDGTSLRCTPEHKLFTYKRGWVMAKDLEKNESVVALKKHMMIQVSAGSGKWPYEHRMIAEKVFGSIPKGHHIDHVDGNCLNNSQDNLQILSPEEHGKKTFTGRIKKQSEIEQQKAKYAEYIKSDKGKKQLSENGRKRSQKFWDSMNDIERQGFINRRNEARYNHKVESIEDAGNEDVYDMEVEDNHSFVAGGVVVHNCTFPEISCITLMHAQATGLTPVIIPYAATDETCQYGYKTKSKDPSDPNIREEYKNLLIKALREDFDREPMIGFAKNKFPWAGVAAEWSKLFKE